MISEPHEFSGREKGARAKRREIRKLAAPVLKEIKREEKKKMVFTDEDFVRADKAERDKRMIMWCGVAFFMILIVVVWIFNARNIFKQPEAANTGNEINWVKMMEEFNKTMESVKGGMSGLSSLNLPGNQQATGTVILPIGEIISTSTATTTELDGLNKGKVDELKTRLEESAGE